MKTVNIDTLLDIVSTNNIETINSFQRYLSSMDEGNISYSIRVKELTEIANFFSLFISGLSATKKNGYFIGCLSTNGISEEFDILRFSTSNILNIEIKSKLPTQGLSRVTRQLERHYNLLQLTHKNIVCISYIVESNTLYLLDKNNLSTISFDTLTELIDDNYIDYNDLLSINPIDLLISPYTDCEKFSSHKYFLNEEQSNSKSEILSSMSKRFLITGGAGSGKTLLLFDLAKHYNDNNSKVLVFFCAQLSLNEISSIKQNIPFDVIEIKKLMSINLDKYDVILVDESHRIWLDYYKYLDSHIDKLIIFSADMHQVLHYNEQFKNIEEIMKKNTDYTILKLNKRIRNSPIFESFIKKFLNLKQRNIEKFIYNGVDVVYFNSQEKACNYIENLQSIEGYISIEPTEYITKTTRELRRKRIYSKSVYTHDVIGREYDKIIIPIDMHYYYDKDGILASNHPDYYPYIESKILFQALTRVRKKLLLVVINNPPIFKTVVEILNWHKE